MRFLMILPVMALSAACSSEPDVTVNNASVEQVQQKVAAAGGRMQMRPGRWEGTMTVRNASPAGVGEGKPGETSTQPIKLCAGQQSAGNPVITQMQEGCRYDSFKLVGGKLDAIMTCARPEVTLKNKLTGEFTADTYKIRSLTEATAESAGPLAGVKAESTIDARRTGDCRGDEGGAKAEKGA